LTDFKKNPGEFAFLGRVEEVREIGKVSDRNQASQPFR
jgi:hypothetical protein